MQQKKEKKEAGPKDPASLFIIHHSLHPHLIHKQPRLLSGAEVPFGKFAVVLDDNLDVAGVGFALDNQILDVRPLRSRHVQRGFAEGLVILAIFGDIDFHTLRIENPSALLFQAASPDL